MEEQIVAVRIRELRPEDTAQAILVWNEVVEDGVAFPQTEFLTEETGRAFFAEQTYVGVAVLEPDAENGFIGGMQAADVDKGARDTIMGLYILHPNNVGRCGHI